MYIIFYYSVKGQKNAKPPTQYLQNKIENILFKNYRGTVWRKIKVLDLVS